MSKREAALLNGLLAMLAKSQQGDRAHRIRHKDRSSAIRASLDDLRRRGVKYCRHAGYGFGWVQGNRVPDEQERAVIDAIRRWRDEGHTWKAISTHLRRHAVLTKDGNLWNSDRVRRAAGARA